MARSQTTPGGPPRRAAAALGVLGALLAAGCGWERNGTVLPLADFAAHQARAVTTDAISPALPETLAHLGYGWSIVPAAGAEPPALELRAQWAALDFFSLAGDTEAVVVEGAFHRSERRGPHQLALELNGQRVGQRPLRQGRTRYRFALPAERMRRGENRLELRLRPESARSQPGRRSAFAIRRIELQSPGARPPRAEPARVRVEEPEGSGPRVLVLPVPSRFDATLPLPEAPRLAAEIGLRTPTAGPSGPVTLRISLQDEGGAEQPLYEGVVGAEGPERLRLDLDRWAGTLARLRLEAMGSTNAELELLDPVVRGRAGADVGLPSLPLPAHLELPERSGLLAGRDVLVVLLDAARADAFTPWGGPYETPAIAALAASGTRFAAARAPSSWTGQSVPAIFTGLYPDSIGIEHWGSRLPPTVPTLAELFADAGYRTVLWTQHPFYQSHRELQRGFEQVTFGSHTDRESLPGRDELLAGDRPVFAFVHLMPPHTPYDPPAPFAGSLTGWFPGEIDVSAKALNQFPRRRDPEELSADELRYIRERYLENAAFADDLVARILAVFHDAGRLDDALVVIVSDHGEAFLEHSRFLHGLHVYGEFLHVPFVIRWPRGIPGMAPVVERPVSLVDLAPTLVDAMLLGQGIGFQGRSLIPEIRGEAAASDALFAYCRGNSDGKRPPKPRSMFESAGWKVVLDELEMEPRLYLKSSDDAESKDLSDRLPNQALLMLQAVRMQRELNLGIRDGLGGSGDQELDADTIERLKALGYLN